ncbi:MAG TPA: DUF456 domain-containing protein [Rhodanobacteraceae bacterium]|nr:DUF456 domain-containing protein [Rhodanobacteraceae bacterium]
MDLAILWYVIAGALIAIGLIGTVLPVLPGVPIMFGGMWLAAWAGHYERVGIATLVLLGILAAISIALDFIAGTLGAKRVGASARAQWGAFLGAVSGIFFGIPGLILGPFIGAVIGQIASGSGVEHSTRVGIATWIGLLFGTIAKLALSFTMLGIFVFALMV